MTEMEKEKKDKKIKEKKDKKDKNKNKKDKKGGKKDPIFPIKDGRIFENELMYCEGREKPLLRGFIHLFGLCSGMIPIGLFEIVKVANTDRTMIILASLFFTSNFICYFVSALFHVLKWPLKVEIFLQKIDHIMACVYAFFSTLLMAYSLFPLKIQLPLSLASFILLVVNVYKIYNCEPSMLTQSLTGFISLLYLPFFYIYTTKREFAFCGIILCLSLIGTIIFIQEAKIPFIDNTIFGHHEVFHLILAIVGVTGYLMMHSMITRKCNGIAC
jgi:predicted membrane channel-forming protein YqfA (hemolysin III family)